MGDDATGPRGPHGPRRTPTSSPTRAVLPWLGVIMGAALTFQGATGRMDAIFLITGPALAVLGIVFFFVYRWMARRGL
jgi:hypothetical protein